MEVEPVQPPHMWSFEPAQPLPTTRKDAKGLCAECAASPQPAQKATTVGHLRCLQTAARINTTSLTRVDQKGGSLLHDAVQHGQLVCAKWLLEQGLSPASQDHVGATPAHRAAYHGHLDCLRLLVLETRGRAANDCALDGSTPIHLCASQGHIECLKWLCSREGGGNAGQLNISGTSALYYAAQEGRLECVKFLVLKCGLKPLIQSEDGMCPIHAAAQCGHLETLQFLLSTIRVRVSNIKDSEGATPMHLAAAQGHVACIRHMLMMGASGSEEDDMLVTPAHEAAQNGHVEVLKLLHEFNANLNSIDSEGFAPIHLATLENHTACVSFLQGHSNSLTDAAPAPIRTLGMRRPEAASTLKHFMEGNDEELLRHDLDNLEAEVLHTDENELAYGFKPRASNRRGVANNRLGSEPDVTAAEESNFPTLVRARSFHDTWEAMDRHTHEQNEQDGPMREIKRSFSIFRKNKDKKK